MTCLLVSRMSIRGGRASVITRSKHKRRRRAPRWAWVRPPASSCSDREPETALDAGRALGVAGFGALGRLVRSWGHRPRPQPRGNGLGRRHSGQSVADPPEAEADQEEAQRGEDRGLDPLDGPEATGRLIRDHLVEFGSHLFDAVLERLLWWTPAWSHVHPGPADDG